MKIIKVSHGTQFFDRANFQNMLDEHLASVHPDTAPKGQTSYTQYEEFISSEVGDIVFVCHSNNTVDVIGMFIDKRPLYSLIEDHYQNEWIDREYVPLVFAKNNTAHHKGKEKWWLPSDNSTCNKVKKEDYNLFEEWILNPVFGVNLIELEKLRYEKLNSLKRDMNNALLLQKKFKNYLSNEDKIFDDVNSLSKVEKLKLYYEYNTKSNIEKSPVVWLRKLVAEHLAEKNVEFTPELLNELKAEVSKGFEKNVFHAWKSNFRILYPLIYSASKKPLTELIHSEIVKIQQDLGIENCTKVNEVYLDGPQNQGYDRIWFAIYNNTHSTQKTAKQLFFEIYDSYKFGLLSHYNPQINNLIPTNEYQYDTIINHFKNFVEEIKSDDINKYKGMLEIKELIEYKKQIILQGPPGTGKTYTAKDLAEFMLTNEVNANKTEQSQFLNASEQFEIIQFHPAYTYEDFIRGIVTETNDEKITYAAKDKLFLDLVNKANKNPEKPYILVIDEINRANLSSVLGELIYALEYRGQNFKSMYADKAGNYEISVPNNLYIIGTMNTADRSVGHLDYALRRRFAFFDVLPHILLEENFEKPLFELVSKLFVKEIKDNTEDLIPSEHLGIDFKDRPQDVWLGHSYFLQFAEYDFSMRIKYEIIPILREYVKDGVLNNTSDVQDIIKTISNYNSESATD